MTTLDYYLNEKWSEIMKIIADSGKVPESVLTYYQSKLISLSNDEALISVPTFINYTIMTQNLGLIEDAVEEVFAKRLKVRIVQQEELNNNLTSLPTDSFKNDFLSRKIDPNQTFANFVVGRSNAQAQIAAMTCASNLGIVFNPLFIYGNSGLGKTHLLNAIANQVRSLYPDKKIGFTSGLEFVEGVHKASVENRFDEFKQVFHDLDVLLIDDVQFIANKAKTHEIFFTVFNELVNNRKQICITSDRTPS